MKIAVYTQLKTGVLDPQGKAVHHALGALKFANVQDVRVGKQIILEINESDRERALAQATQMCEELLANTVIEDYRVEVLA